MYFFFLAQVHLADNVHERLQNLSLSGIQLDWDRVGTSLRVTSVGASSATSLALSRQLQGLGSLKRVPSRTRRATDSNLVLGSHVDNLIASSLPTTSFTAIARGSRVRRATEDNVTLSQRGSLAIGPFRFAMLSIFTEIYSTGLCKITTDRHLFWRIIFCFHTCILPR